MGTLFSGSMDVPAIIHLSPTLWICDKGVMIQKNVSINIGQHRRYHRTVYMLHTEIDLLIRHFDTFAQAKARSDLNLFLGWAGGWGWNDCIVLPMSLRL